MTVPPFQAVNHPAHQPNDPTVMMMWSQRDIKTKSWVASLKFEKYVSFPLNLFLHQSKESDATINKVWLYLFRI